MNVNRNTYTYRGGRSEAVLSALVPAHTTTHAQTHRIHPPFIHHPFSPASVLFASFLIAVPLSHMR